MSLEIRRDPPRNNSQIIGWSSEPIKVSHIASNFLFVGEGAKLLIWKLDELQNLNYDPLTTLYPFTQGESILSISSYQITEKNQLIVLLLTLNEYRLVNLNISKHHLKDDYFMSDKFRRDRTFQGEFICGHIINSTLSLLYDAYNKAYLFNSVTKSIESTYSGNLGGPDAVLITGASVKEIIIFISTFSTVIICRLEEDTKLIRPFNSFEQEKGVIFSINFYPENFLILTASDDRAVSVWSLKLNNSQNAQNSVQIINNSAILANGISVKLKCRLEGHTDRVFGAILAENYVLSVGEDSELVAWPIHNLDLEKRVIGSHGGATIWTCSYSPLTKKIYTCSNDGSVSSWPLTPKNYENSESKFMNPWKTPLPHISNLIKTQNDFTKELPQKDFPRIVKFFSSESVITTSNLGRLFILEKNKVLYENNNSEWKNYATFALSPDKSLLAIGTINGKLHFIKLPGYSEINKDEVHELDNAEKILALYFISSSQILVSTLNHFQLYTLHPHSTQHDKNINFGKKLEKNLTNPNATLSWSLKSKETINCLIIVSNSILIGTQSSKIILLSLESGDLISELKSAHNKYGVVALGSFKGMILSGGRDGRIIFYKLEKNGNNESRFELLHAKTSPLPFSWVGGFHETPHDLLISGFDSTDFVLYSMRREEVISRVSCGGAHRSWDFLITENGGGIFTHIRSGAISSTLIDITTSSQSSIKDKFHSDDINCCVQLPHPNPFLLLFGTGSEDTKVKISSFIINNNKLNECKFELRRSTTITTHSSAVRSIAYQEIVPFSEGILVSGGGKSEIMITKVNLGNDDEITYYRLRRVIFDGSVDFRIMELQSLSYSQPQYINKIKNNSVQLAVFAACSDGCLRLLTVDTSQKISVKVHLLESENEEKINKTQHCITSLRALNVENFDKNDKIILVVGDSAGLVHLYSINNFHLKTFPNSSPHLRLINCYEMETAVTSLEFLANKEFLTLVCGGDDGTLHSFQINYNILANETSLKSFSKIQVGTEGILSLLKSDSLDCFYFLGGSKLYCAQFKNSLQLGESLIKFKFINVPILDGKGFKICGSTLKIGDKIVTPYVVFGKGFSINAFRSNLAI